MIHRIDRLVLAALVGLVPLAAGAESVLISGSTVQHTDIRAGSEINNLQPTGNGATARQSFATNRGDVRLRGPVRQEVVVDGATINNIATGDGSYAEQSLAVNQGNVRISGPASQSVLIGSGALLYNLSGGSGSRAIQEFSTNSGCTTCR